MELLLQNLLYLKGLLAISFIDLMAVGLPIGHHCDGIILYGIQRCVWATAQHRRSPLTTIFMYNISTSVSYLVAFHISWRNLTINKRSLVLSISFTPFASVDIIIYFFTQLDELWCDSEQRTNKRHSKQVFKLIKGSNANISVSNNSMLDSSDRCIKSLLVPLNWVSCKGLSGCSLPLVSPLLLDVDLITTSFRLVAKVFSPCSPSTRLAEQESDNK